MKRLKAIVAFIKSYINISRIQKLLIVLKILNFCFFDNNDSFAIIIQFSFDFIEILKNDIKF